MSEDDINKQVSKETGSMSSVSVGIELDKESLRGLRDSVKAINKEAKEMAINFRDALAALKEMKNDYGLTQVNRSTAISPGGSAPQQGAAGTQIVGGRASATQPIPPAPNAVTAALSRREVLGGGFAAGVDSAENYAGVKGKFGGGTGFTGLMQQWAGGGFTSGGNFASMAGTLAKVGIEAIDKRVEDGRAYALAADKSTLQMQQITGMSQREVMNNLRMPLTDYKLGTNGINQLMSLQARTGINASQQASSVEFMRTLSGFSMGAEGASSIIENLADPETVNKMFMMTGMSLIGPGGKQRSTQSLIQNLAKRSGLDNKKMAESAIAPGSVTRSTLSAMGVSGDLQDQVIQYAQSNVAFHEKGGKGSYDPTKEADRKKMGINDTYAMEAEETERKRGKRDEQFYRDQAGSYAKLERQTQSLTDAMGKLEHAMAPIIGARTGNRIGQKLIGGIASIAGGFAMGGPLGGALGAIGAIGSILGDPRPIGDERDDEPWGTVAPGVTTAPAPVTTIPTTNGGGGGGGGGIILNFADNKSTIEHYDIWKGLGHSDAEAWSGKNMTRWPILMSGNDVVNYAPNVPQSDFGGLDFSFRRMLTQMSVMAEREGVGKLIIRDGKRDGADQRRLFTSRFKEVPSTDQNRTHYTDSADGKQYPVIFFEGKKWMKIPGNMEPYAAPPGESLHEMGLAADLDLSDPKMAAWVAKNATRFGIASPDANEPFHVQPSYAKNIKNRTQFNQETGVTVSSDGKHDDFGFRFNSNLHSTAQINPNIWSVKFLKGIGAPTSLNNIQFIKAWMAAEGSGGRYNPLNNASGRETQYTADGVLKRERFFSDRNGLNNPVINFATEEEGLNYSVNRTRNGNTALLEALRKGDVSLQDLAHLRNLAGGGAAEGALAPGTYTEATWKDAAAETGPASASHYTSAAFGKAFGGFAGDPTPDYVSQPLSIPSAPMLSSGSSGTGSTFHEGNTITISPVIHMNGTGGNSTVSEYDLKLMAKKIARLIEQEANINKFRSM